MHDGCHVEESARRVDGGIKVLCEPAIASDQGKKPLDDPTARLNGEADLVGVLAHDLDGDQRGLGNSITRVFAVGEDPLDKREDIARGPQKRPAAVAILDTRRMRFEHETAPICIDEGMALAAVNSLAGIIAAWPTGFRRLYALTVDDSSRGTGLPPESLAISHDKRVVDLLEQTGIAPCRKPAIDRAPRRKVRWQLAPRTTGLHDVADAVDDLPQRPCAWPSRLSRWRQMWLDQAPFLIGHITLVTHGIADIIFAVGLGPHGNSLVDISSPWNHFDLDHAIYF